MTAERTSTQKTRSKTLCSNWLKKSSHAEGTKEENLEEIIDFTVKSLFKHFNSENYLPKYLVNVFTLAVLLPWLPSTSHAGLRGPNSACGYRTGLHHLIELWSMALLYNGNQELTARLPLFLHRCFIFQASLQPMSPAQGSLPTAGSLQLFSAPKSKCPRTWWAKE